MGIRVHIFHKQEKQWSPKRKATADWEKTTLGPDISHHAFSWKYLMTYFWAPVSKTSPFKF